MESVIKTSRCTHPGSDNDKKLQNQSDTAPLRCKKDTKVCYRKVIPMKLAVKMSGPSNPGSDSDEKNKNKINHVNSDKAPLSWEKTLDYVTAKYYRWNRQ